MAWLLDTDVMIHLRDGDDAVLAQVAALGARPFISVVTRVELEGGVCRDPAEARVRRMALDVLLRTIIVLLFMDSEADAYRNIIAATGWSRTRIFDRMIAATALVAGATLVTINGDDFRDIPDLALEVWTSPARPC